MGRSQISKPLYCGFKLNLLLLLVKKPCLIAWCWFPANILQLSILHAARFNRLTSFSNALQP